MDSGRVNTSAVSAMPAVGERDHVTGSSSPKLTLVEYGDFGCPYCFQASRPVKSLLDRFDGLRLVWRHFPVPALHPRADLAAELAELAGLHGQFWDRHRGRPESWSPRDADLLRRWRAPEPALA